MALPMLFAEDATMLSLIAGLLPRRQDVSPDDAAPLP